LGAHVRASDSGVFTVTDYGAKANGRDYDTRAIQSAIDACTSAGGGRVYCPPGTYLTGSLVLKDNVELHLEAGATLLGSPDRKDYPPQYDRETWSGNFEWGRHLIYARKARNVAISGRGTINGNGKTFFSSEGIEYHLRVPSWRPGPMVTFVECEDIRIRDVLLTNSPAFNILFAASSHVSVTGVSIVNEHNTPNTDGIDLVCSTNVHISDCYISTGDDCIGVFSYVRPLGLHAPSENITVTNCTLSTSCNAIRVGYASDGPIRNCTFSNLIMPKTRTGINMLVEVEDNWAIESDSGNEHGPVIENIIFSNIVMETEIPIYLWISDKATRPASLRNLSFSNLTATTNKGCYIGGARNLPIEGLSIRDLKLTIFGEKDDRFTGDIPYPYNIWGYHSTKGLPYGIYCRYVNDIALRGIDIKWSKTSGPWKNAIFMEGVSTADFDSVVASGVPADDSSAALRLRDVSYASIRNCRAAESTPVFVRVEGGLPMSVVAVGNDLTKALRAFDITSTSVQLKNLDQF